ncbi:PIN domain-containing protein [Luteolibacter flavescens]|uniref:PIN domain-containing protein n=1 Tax=Luteolibacter flavescens TaxID=1859460 RepID=A0ABT3FJF2_9BACT|nr:PIN domain-containing protein [Luteolibacter flavescens]MCW1883670.1 PIN domain-containing protein [Luteolibacter flavescens]
MSVPKTIFLDTSIFDEMSYNFEAASVVAFKRSIEGMNLTLVMPDPTEREIRRHINDKAKNAAATLEGLGRRFPPVRKLAGWPLVNKSGPTLAVSIYFKGIGSLHEFYKNFKLVKLGYEAVKIDTVMDWYDHGLAPFSEKKRKEFPDAIALMALGGYYNETGEGVAIISKDGDFRTGCERFPGLFYFPSLAAYSEALKGVDDRVAAIQLALGKDDTIITNAITDEFMESSFVAAYENGEVVETEFEDISETVYHVVGLGESSCSIAFELEFLFRATVEYEKCYFDDFHINMGRVRDRASATGIIKLTTSADFSELTEVESVAMDEHEYKVREHPRDHYY